MSEKLIHILRLRMEKMASTSANVLNKSLQAVGMGWSTSLGVGWEVNSPSF
jgi:hypothetical protein